MISKDNNVLNVLKINSTYTLIFTAPREDKTYFWIW